VERLAKNFHGFGQGGSTSGDDKKLLEGKLVSGVFSSVDDIEARNRHGLGDGVFGNLGVVLPKRNSLGGGSGLGGGKRYSKNGVGSNIGLVVGSLGLDNDLVNGGLVGGINSHDGVGQDGLGVFKRCSGWLRSRFDGGQEEGAH